MGEAGAGNLSTNTVVAGELIFGAKKKRSRRLRAVIDGILVRMNVLPIDAAVAETYAEIRAALERAGTPIGANDLWIAAHACAKGMTLVTANVREFRRVPDLKLENWLAGD